MKGQDLIVSAFQDLRRAAIKFGVAANELSSSNAKRIFNKYSDRCIWIVNDFVTNPIWPDYLRNAMRRDFSSDELATESIFAKLDLLPPEKRDELEELVDKWISEYKIRP